jgi:3-oxoacyl-ACP reductase-like protein
MPRADLSQLLGNVEESEPPIPTQTASEPAVGPAPVRAATPASTAARIPVKLAPEYLRLVRKETRLREDQLNQLTLHARRLSRAKTGSGPRITDNTLIRVAVDLLLARIEQANGDNEAAILESLK